MEILEQHKKHGLTHSIGSMMCLEDLNACLEKLACHNSHGKNSVSPNAVKVLESCLRIKLLNFMSEWLTSENVSYPESLTPCVKMLPKKVDLKNPNN